MALTDFNPGPVLAKGLVVYFKHVLFYRLSRLIRAHSTRAGFRHFSPGPDLVIADSVKINQNW